MRGRLIGSIGGTVAMVISLAMSQGPARAMALCHPELKAIATPDLGAPGEFTSVVAISHRDAWAVGNVDAETAALRMHWDDRSWSVVSGPDPGVSSALEAVAATGPDDVWAVGATNDGVTDTSLIEHWDGNAWSLSPNPGDGGLLGVVAISPTNVWAVGEALLILHYDGTSWTKVSHPPLEEGDLHAAAASGPNDVWFAGGMESEGGGEVPLTMRWDGSLVAVVPPIVPDVEGADFRAVAALSPTDVWAVGEQEEPPFAHTLVQHWDGAAWSVVASPNPGDDENELRGIAALSPTDIFAVGGYAADEVDHPLAMHWDGARWRQVSSQEPFPGEGITEFHGVSALSSLELWAVGAHGPTEEDADPLIEGSRGCR